MKKNNSIYWISTGILSTMMLFSAYNYIASPQMATAFKHLGFPDYLRYELAIAKVLGALALIIPQIPVRVKEWAYAGFGITFISAFIGHISSGDPVSVAMMPLVFFAVLVISNIYLYKKQKTTVASFKTSLA